jgi:hypothetical protein
MLLSYVYVGFRFIDLLGYLICVEKAKTAKKKFKNKRTPFSEGWVEFKDKHTAKRVAFSLNNTQISNKRSNRWFDEVWNIKYLPKFHWGHLNERLAYERAVRQQKLRAEITQAKKETGYFVQGIEKTKILQRLEKKRKLPADKQQREWSFKQKDVDDEDAAKSSPAKDTESSAPANKKPKRGPPASAASNTNFLRTLFSGGVARRDNNVTQNNDAAN